MKPSLKSSTSIKKTQFIQILSLRVFSFSHDIINIWEIRRKRKGLIDIKIENEESRAIVQEQQQILLENAPKLTKTWVQKAMRKTFKGTAHLSRLLPTGSVLAFQTFSPILTQQGPCPTHISRLLTQGLLALSGIACFLLCLPDSFRDETGKVRYGIATFRGLWVIDVNLKLTPRKAAKYRLKFIDFFHAFASVLGFAAVALFDKNVVHCFSPAPSEDAKELLLAVPGIGEVFSVLFVLFPSKRHGIGCSLSRY